MSEEEDKFDPFAAYVVPKVGRIERWRRRIRDCLLYTSDAADD